MTDGLVPSETLGTLKSRYAESHRHYHTWAHVDALLKWLDQVIVEINDRHSVRLAILYHDAIYDPRSSGNEAESAALMRSELDGIVSFATLERANALILATAGHQLIEVADSHLVSDCAFFLDMDLSVFGTDPAIFEAYDEAIRQEYSFVPFDDYRRGRSAILRGFLERKRIYFTEHFHDLLEQQARSNLSRSIERLKQD